MWQPKPMCSCTCQGGGNDAHTCYELNYRVVVNNSEMHSFSDSTNYVVLMTFCGH